MLQIDGANTFEQGTAQFVHGAEMLLSGVSGVAHTGAEDLWHGAMAVLQGAEAVSVPDPSLLPYAAEIYSGAEALYKSGQLASSAAEMMTGAQDITQGLSDSPNELVNGADKLVAGAHAYVWEHPTQGS